MTTANHQLFASSIVSSFKTTAVVSFHCNESADRAFGPTGAESAMKGFNGRVDIHLHGCRAG
jgi:hypothetical protein